MLSNMNSTVRFFLIFAISISAVFSGVWEASAQSGFQETITGLRKDPAQHLGRDFWFAPAQNGANQPGKYIRLYIASPVSTMAHIEYGGHKDSVRIPSSSSSVYFNIPLADELQSSGVVENKAIHVYSTDADLSVYLFSRIPNSADGMFCIPTVSLGTDYVVAAYESPHGNADLPSEFTITATADSTIVEITPTVNLRQSSAFPANNTVVMYGQGQTFEVVLRRGQAVQYQSVFPQDSGICDVTGTIIHSNNPVSVVGASMGPEIPRGYPNSNYVCDMIPPVRAWGKTYYSTDFRFDQSGAVYGSGRYLIVSSEAQQVIYASGCSSGWGPTVIENQYGVAWAEPDGVEKFWSDAPFLLIEYSNSSTVSFPAAGDPAEVSMTPLENYTKTVFFQVPNISEPEILNTLALLFVYSKDASNVTVDGLPLSGARAFPQECSPDGSVALYILSDLRPGTHVVTSDSGASVYVYGYGDTEAYAWAGSLGTGFLNDSVAKDTVPPGLSFVPDSSCLRLAISDSGSGISEIIPDSARNISFTLDPSFVSGSGIARSDAELCPKDPLQSGYVRILVTDRAGNSSTADITYTHPPIVSSPGFTAAGLGFDTVRVGTGKTLPILTVTDTSVQYPITIDNIWVNDPAFIFDKSLAANALPLTLAAGAQHRFSITFIPKRDSFYSAAVHVHSTELLEQSATVTGVGYSVSASVATTASPQNLSVALLPNPAARHVLVTYSLLHAGLVEFELVTLLGERVREWNEEIAAPGEHSKTLDLSGLPEGTYIYRMDANGEVQSGKLIVGP